MSGFSGAPADGTLLLMGSLSANPNIAAGTLGYIYPIGGRDSAPATASTFGSRWYNDTGRAYTISSLACRLHTEALGAGDTFTMAVYVDGVSVGSVTFEDGDAVGLLRSTTFAAASVPVGSYVMVVYSQTDLSGQDNRAAWSIPLN